MSGVSPERSEGYVMSAYRFVVIGNRLGRGLMPTLGACPTASGATAGDSVRRVTSNEL
jgi:hypothetical protein